MRLLLFATILVAIVALPLGAGVIFNPNVPGILWPVSPTRPNITGADMAGMHVVASYDSGHDSPTAVWQATGATSGAAGVAGWFTLSESGDTFGGNWILTNLNDASLVDLHLVSGPGKGGINFDRTDPNPGTVNTARGWDFQLVGSDNGKYNVTVEFINLVGNPALGDAYWKMDLVSILAVGTNAGIVKGDTMTFIQDTDKIPEPATYLILGSGLTLFGLLRRRRMRR